MAKRGPLFLKRQSYRRRRLRDLSRLLPVIGLVLLMIPVLWSPGNSPRADTAPDGLYLFWVWAVLIAVAALLAPSLTAETGEEGAEEER